MLMSHAGCQTPQAGLQQGPRSSIHITPGLALTASPARSGLITPTDTQLGVQYGSLIHSKSCRRRNVEADWALGCRAQNHGSLRLRTHATGKTIHPALAAEAPPPALVAGSVSLALFISPPANVYCVQMFEFNFNVNIN